MSAVPIHQIRNRWNANSASCALILFAALTAASCAKVGAPRPPELRVARPSTDLTARQQANEAVLRVSAPVQNTTGSPVTNLKYVEVFRRIETTAAPAVTEEEFIASAASVITVSADDLQKYASGGTLVFRDPLGPADQPETYRQVRRYAVRFVNTSNQTAGLGNQVVIAPVPVPPPPKNIAVERGQEFVRLRWNAPAANMDGSAPARVAGYNLYRAERPDQISAALLNPELLTAPEFEDRGFAFDTTYYYAVKVIASRADPYAESAVSDPVKVLTTDVFAPDAPERLNAVVETRTVVLLWVAPPQSDVAGYRIHRSRQGNTARELLTPSPVQALSYRDEGVPPGSYEYSVSAIDTHNNEGAAARISVEVP